MGGKRTLSLLPQVVEKEPQFGSCNQRAYTYGDPKPARVLRLDEFVTSKNEREHARPKSIRRNQCRSGKQTEASHLVKAKH